MDSRLLEKTGLTLGLRNVLPSLIELIVYAISSGQVNSMSPVILQTQFMNAKLQPRSLNYNPFWDFATFSE